MLSIVIPSRNEQFLPQTVDDLMKKAKGEIEIIVIMDGYWHSPPLPANVKIIHRGKSRGMRNGITSAVAIATGEYIMKIDAHCMVDEGFDIKLLEEIEDNWIVIPRRKRLDAENWCIQDVGKPDIDYEYLSFPDNPHDWGGAGLNGRKWDDFAKKKLDILIDDTPASQGSCWLMKKSYFEELGLMDEENWGPFWCESQELAFRCVLTGGRYVVNKKTWYAHLHKGRKYGRGYSMDSAWHKQGRDMAMRFFAGEKVWEDQKYPLSYLLEMYPLMPGWKQSDIEDLKKREWK